MRLVVYVGSLLLLASAALAQEVVGPRAGAWGFEVSGSGASLLKFRREQSAWLVGAYANYRNTDREASTLSGSVAETEASVTMSARIGLRKYAHTDRRARPFVAPFAFGAIGLATEQDSWNAGVGVELGAAWFFSPHVSLGGSAELAGGYGRSQTRGTGYQSDTRTLSIQFPGLRFIGAVYF